MASCLICDYSINVPNQAQAAASRQKEIFQVFCKLVGIPEQEIETFAIDYDVENHSPFCNACAHYPLDLSKNEDSRTRIEDEVLALQITICKKLRELSERKIEADGIVRQIRNRIENQDPDVDVWKESNGSRKNSRASFKNRIRKLTPLRGSGIGNIGIPNTVISANAIEEYPGNFVVPNDITKIVVTKVEIKDEPIEYADDGAFNAMEEAIEYLEGRESLTPGDEDMVCSYEEDYNDSIGIDPLSINQHSDKNVQGILWQNSAEGISGKIVSKSTRSKRRTGSNKKRKRKKKFTQAVTDDSVSESTRIMPKRKSAIVSKRTQKSQLRKMNSDSENSDKNDSVDNDWVEKKELEQQQVKVCKYKEPKDPIESQLELIKYLGEIKKTEDGKLAFRNIEIIERQVNKLECGQCGFISAEGGTYPNSILIVSMRMRKHVMEKHLGGYSCPLCFDRPPAQKFRTQLKHMRVKHSSGIGIECGICAKPYKYQSEAYRFHLFTHKSKEEKEEAIGSGVKLTSYRFRVNSDKKFHCKDCEKSFVGEAQLNRHMESHRDKEERDKERVPCCVCGRLQYPNFIKNHERSHQNQGIKKPEPLPRHPCTICHRRFPTPYQVSLHVRRAHTGEKPFVCQICSRAFHCYSQLKIHMKSHSTERLFSCQFCAASYKSRSNLQRHQKSSHPTTEETDCT